MLLASSLFMVSSPVFATSLTAQETLNQFNLVVLGDAKSTSHVDGRSYIGGNLNGGTYVQHPNDTPSSNYAGLTVGGNATGVMVNNLGAVVGGNLTGSTINSGNTVVSGTATNNNFNGPAAVNTIGSGNNFNGGLNPALATGTAATAATSTSFADVLTGLSFQLSGLAGTGSTVTINGSKATFNAVVGSNNVAVFDLTGIDTQLFGLSEFEFNLGSAKTVIFNSDDASATIGANFLGGSAQAIGAKSVWNFYNATSLTINSQFGGSILAPKASFSNMNNIEGGVYVNSLTQYGEIHLQSFTGDVPDVPSSPVPEPATMLLMGSGIAGIFAAARRKKKA